MIVREVAPLARPVTLHVLLALRIHLDDFPARLAGREAVIPDRIRREGFEWCIAEHMQCIVSRREQTLCAATDDDGRSGLDGLFHDALRHLDDALLARWNRGVFDRGHHLWCRERDGRREPFAQCRKTLFARRHFGRRHAQSCGDGIDDGVVIELPSQRAGNALRHLGSRGAVLPRDGDDGHQPALGGTLRTRTCSTISKPRADHAPSADGLPDTLCSRI